MHGQRDRRTDGRTDRQCVASHSEIKVRRVSARSGNRQIDRQCVVSEIKVGSVSARSGDRQTDRQTDSAL